jgi:hypothetical protein
MLCSFCNSCLEVKIWLDKSIRTNKFLCLNLVVLTKRRIMLLIGRTIGAKGRRNDDEHGGVLVAPISWGHRQAGVLGEVVVDIVNHLNIACM